MCVCKKPLGTEYDCDYEEISMTYACNLVKKSVDLDVPKSHCYNVYVEFANV